MTSGARKLQELATQKKQELHKIREEHYHALERLWSLVKRN